jgi:undecaprenyl-diphosphatase
VFFYKLFPKLKWAVFISASLVALSRVYIGVHYPSDILGGAVIGSAFGYIFAIAALKLDQIIDDKFKTKEQPA